MMGRYLCVVLVFTLSILLFHSASPVVAIQEQNLLDNPGAETGDISGWTIISSGGNGWGVSDEGFSGGKSFATSYEWCKRYQEVDLLSKGFTTEYLDTAPSIIVEEWFAGYGAVWMYDWCHEDYAYLRVELRDTTHTVIASYDTGVFQLPDATEGWFGPWVQKSHEFPCGSYGPGLRYVYFEDGGKDREFWAGRYGARLDAAYVSVPQSVTIGGDVCPEHIITIISPWIALGLAIVAGVKIFMRRHMAQG